MAAVLLVVVAFSWAHSTARVSWGYDINASARGTQEAERIRPFRGIGYKMYRDGNICLI